MSKDKRLLNIKSAEINFIYSFIPVCNFTLTSDHRINEVFPINNYVFPDYELLKEMFPNSTMSPPEERKGGLSAFLVLEQNMGFERLPDIEGQLVVDNVETELKVVVKPLLRFFPTGCSCNLSVNVMSNTDYSQITPSDIHNLLNLVGNVENKEARNKLKVESIGNYTIYDIFNNIMVEKETEWDEMNQNLFNDTIGSQTKDDIKSYNQHNPQIIILCREHLRVVTEPFDKRQFENNNLVLNLFEKNILRKEKEDPNLVRFNYFIKHKRELNILLKQEEVNQKKKVLDIWQQYRKHAPEPHYPYAIINLEVNDENEFCESFFNEDGTTSYNDKQRAIRKYEDVIAPLLYRTPIKKISSWETEPAYLYASSPNAKKGFYNMFLNSKFFVHITKRSILTITKSFKKKPATFVLPTLKDISEMTLCRWQTLVILNRVLDEQIRTISYNNIDAKDKLAKMISSINLCSLCLEDPAIYMVSGEALCEFHEDIVGTFKLKELSDTLIKKIDLLERAYNRTLEKNFFRRFPTN